MKPPQPVRLAGTTPRSAEWVAPQTGLVNNKSMWPEIYRVRRVSTYDPLQYIAVSIQLLRRASRMRLRWKKDTAYENGGSQLHVPHFGKLSTVVLQSTPGGGSRHHRLLFVFGIGDAYLTGSSTVAQSPGIECPQDSRRDSRCCWCTGRAHPPGNPRQAGPIPTRRQNLAVQRAAAPAGRVQRLRLAQRASKGRARITWWREPRSPSG